MTYQRENNGLFGSSSRPYYYKDPEDKPVRVWRLVVAW